MSTWAEVRKQVAEARSRVSRYPDSDEKTEALKELADIEATALENEREERRLLLRLSVQLQRKG